MITTRYVPLALASLLAACGGAPAAPDAPATAEEARAAESADAGAPEYTVTFRDRTIDLEPHVQGFPYRGFEAFIEAGQMIYFESRPDGQHMRLATLGTDAIELSEGTAVNDIDWSTRSYWGAWFHEPTGQFIAWGDERNDERMNLFAIDPADGTVTPLTDNDYTYGLGLSADENTLAYVRRTGVEAPFTSCLRLLDLTTGDDREVICDSGDDRFTWTYVEFAPDGSDAIVTLQHDGNRSTENIARVDLEAEEPTFELLLERGVEHVTLGVVPDTYDGSSVVITSSLSGFQNLYRVDLGNPTMHALTSFDAEVGSVSILNEENGWLFAVVDHPWESELLVLDADGTVLASERRPTAVSLLDAHDGVAVIRESSVASPFSMHRVTVADDGASMTMSPIAAVPNELAEQIIHCEPRRIEYPTFDTLEDGSPRMIHAWYMAPSEPAANDERLVRITSFYGGANSFSTSAQIMCQAGVATLSPAVRGSWGYGAEFAQLNDGDLGGDEIVDLFYAARWLEAEEGYAPSQIGVYGGSHGGYATMRALTFPPETNDRNDSYPFGFGLSHAGFSNILTFYETCNIPDWVVLEAGDPETEADKLLDRSPISHVDLLQAPILLTHGENDWRVPVDESRTFAAAAEELGRPVTYVEFAGQGHGIQGLENVLTYYRTVFGFLAGL